MATLQFKGKSAVWNHHLSVPYHTLEKDAKKSLKGTDAEENLIIEGDNLLALKSLLPKYQGRIKCIYIDPPYNTGNEGWAYNDNVNSPTIREWIGKAVGKDDLTRHDKWLSMMTPRLKLLRELLADDGVIFVSIGDDEVARLKNLLDEIFDENYFYACLTWINRTKPTNMGEARFNIQQNVEYILVYGKKTMTEHPRLRLYQTEEKSYPEKDKQGRAYRIEEIVQRRNIGSLRRDTMLYPLLGTNPKEGYRWQLSKKKYEELKKSNLLTIINKKPYRIYYKDEEQDSFAYEPFWSHLEDVGTAESGKMELNDILGRGHEFETVKPIELIKQLVYHTTTDDDIILDSFAGSGTTAHAVLEVNKEHGGNRKYILVEMEDYANRLTAERVRKVIKQGKYKSGFAYQTLGPAIDSESILTGKLPTYKEFAKYVYYLATGKNHPDEKKIKEEDSFVGKTDHQSVYLIYEKNVDALKKLAITLDWAQKTHKKDSNKKIVYAPACYLDEEALEQFNIKFVSIPYNLFERS